MIRPTTTSRAVTPTVAPASSTPGWIDQGGGTYTFNVCNLDVGQTGSVLFAVKVASSLPPG